MLQVLNERAISALPLNALRAFDICARHLSFTKAARELGVSQSAISYQVQLLEHHLGVPLFSRARSGITLTAAAVSYVKAVRMALLHLEHASATVRSGHETRITCSIATTIAMRWLMPRLGGFSIQYPDITIRLDITERFVDFDQEKIDLAVRYGAGDWPGLAQDLLFREVLVPVCSPKLLRGRRKLNTLQDLKRQTLLHACASMRDWQYWLRARRSSDIDAKSGLIFDQPHGALQAAMEGLGIAMADQCLVERELTAGTLVIPFKGGLARTEGYYVVGKAEARESLGVGPLWRWLIAQGAERPGQERAALGTAVEAHAWSSGVEDDRAP